MTIPYTPLSELRLVPVKLLKRINELLLIYAYAMGDEDENGNNECIHCLSNPHQPGCYLAETIEQLKKHIL